MEDTDLFTLTSTEQTFSAESAYEIYSYLMRGGLYQIGGLLSKTIFLGVKSRD